MSSLIIRATVVNDVSSIVKIRLKIPTEEELSGFSAPELATTSSNERLLKV